MGCFGPILVDTRSSTRRQPPGCSQISMIHLSSASPKPWARKSAQNYDNTKPLTQLSPCRHQGPAMSRHVENVCSNSIRILRSVETERNVGRKNTGARASNQTSLRSTVLRYLYVQYSSAPGIHVQTPPWTAIGKGRTKDCLTSWLISLIECL